MTEPTDAELDAVMYKHWPAFSMQATLVRMRVRAAMRAALAKWGTPQPVAREPSKAEIVFAAISSGEWTVTRNQPSCYLTDEGNARNAWSVQRAVAPYCADLGPGNRSWNGPTALAALKAASKEMGIPLPITQKVGSNAE